MAVNTVIRNLINQWNKWRRGYKQRWRKNTVLSRFSESRLFEVPFRLSWCIVVRVDCKLHTQFSCTVYPWEDTRVSGFSLLPFSPCLCVFLCTAVCFQCVLWLNLTMNAKSNTESCNSRFSVAGGNLGPFHVKILKSYCNNNSNNNNNYYYYYYYYSTSSLFGLRAKWTIY